MAQWIALHNASFAQSKRPLPVARAAASNLPAHLLATVQAAVGRTPSVAALAPPSTRLLVLVGHDTNLATLGGLLGVDWHRSDRPDDYPPGGALVLDVLERNGALLLRVWTLMPSMAALRSAHFDGDALALSTLVLPGCHGQALCPLPVALAWLRKRLDPAQCRRTCRRCAPGLWDRELARIACHPTKEVLTLRTSMMRRLTDNALALWTRLEPAWLAPAIADTPVRAVRQMSRLYCLRCSSG
ncbi:6-phytase [Xanthomonas bromi]|uniref:6-phytase n=1 Tax=Xanthomonas bromi TaxID=56449 RepID=A0A1C3NQL7_9XANT|nr:6-phytase [Xanthomonas bromi]